MKYLTTKGIVLIGLLSTNLHISEMVFCIETTKIDATVWMKIQYMLHVLALTDQIRGTYCVYSHLVMNLSANKTSSFSGRRQHGSALENPVKSKEEEETEASPEGSEGICQQVITAEDDYYDGR